MHFPTLPNPKFAGKTGFGDFPDALAEIDAHVGDILDAIDELRIGETFAEVTPHTASPDPDSDGDGLSDAQEAVLGLDPQVSNAALVAAIQAHPDYFNLFTAAGILAQDNGGVILQKSGSNPLSFTFEVQHSDNLQAWPALETITREVTLPADKQFLRVTLDSIIP